MFMLAHVLSTWVVDVCEYGHTCAFVFVYVCVYEIYVFQSKISFH